MPLGHSLYCRCQTTNGVCVDKCDAMQTANITGILLLLLLPVLHHAHRLLRCVSAAVQVNHMSPEMLRYGKASASADVYSFGIMLWELLTGQVAFRGWQWGAILEHVALSDGRPPIPEGAPEDFVLLLESCWHKDPARRPAFTEVGPRAARATVTGFLAGVLSTGLLQSGRAGWFAVMIALQQGYYNLRMDGQAGLHWRHVLYVASARGGVGK